MSSNRLSETFFKHIVESNWVAVTYADLTGVISYTNNAANKLYGYDKDELIGKNVDVFNADTNQITEVIINSIKETGGWEGEITQKKKDNTCFKAYLSVWLIKDEQGVPIGLASSSKDITEEKAIQEQLNRGKETVSLLLDSLPIGIYILDAEGKPFYANNFTKALSKTPESAKIEDLDDMNQWQVFKQNTDIPYPLEELPIIKALKGEKCTVSDLDIVVLNQRYHVSVTAQPVYVDNKIAYAVPTFLDISEILNKQKEIERRENEIQALINSHDFYFFSVDKNFKIIRYNNTFKTSIEAFGIVEVDGFDVKGIIPKEQLEEIIELYETAFSGETITDTRNYDAGGEYRTYETKYAPIFRGDEVYAVSVMSQNITKRINNENKLKEALNAVAQKESEIWSIINNTDAMILSIDKNYKIIEYNDAFSKMVSTHFEVKTLKGTYVLNYLIPSSHEHIKKMYDKAFGGETIIDEYSYQTSEGHLVFETRYTPIIIDNHIVAISIFSQNISYRKENEKRLKSALEEKELLLNEIHHRVKNNLAIISSLLQLEELKTSHKETKDILISSQNRIKSTALVHQFLYQNDSISKIQFKEYITEFISQVKRSLLSDLEIDITVGGEGFTLDIEQAIPCGLILNELFTNSVKHAFKNVENPKINIILTKEVDAISVEFSDNGNGFAENISESNSLGMTVVKTLVKQLRGKLQMSSDQGAKFLITFGL